MFLAKRNHDRDGALSAPEIGLTMQARGRIRKSSPSEWARPKLNRLRDDGLVEELGWSPNGAWTWALTDIGRAVAAYLEANDAR